MSGVTREEFLIRGTSFHGVALYGVGAGHRQTGESAQREVHHQSPVVNKFLKFSCRGVAVAEHKDRLLHANKLGTRESRHWWVGRVQSHSPPSTVRLRGSGLCVPRRPLPGLWVTSISGSACPAGISCRVPAPDPPPYRINCPRQSQRRYGSHVAVRGQPQRSQFEEG